MYNDEIKEVIKEREYQDGYQKSGLANAAVTVKGGPFLESTLKSIIGIVQQNDIVLADLFDTVQRFHEEPAPPPEDPREHPIPLNGFVGELNNYVRLLERQNSKMQDILHRLKNIIG